MIDGKFMTFLCLLLAVPAAARDLAGLPVTDPAAAAAVPAAPVADPLPHAPKGTRVELMVFDEVTTKTAQPGQRFKLKLAQPLLVGDRVILPRGVAAWGEVTTVTGNGMVGKSGKLGTKLLYLDHGGDRIAIEGAPASSGQGGTAQVVLATLALTPWGLFAKGNNAKLKAGDIVFAYLVDGYSAAGATPRRAVAPVPGAPPVSQP